MRASFRMDCASGPCQEQTHVAVEGNPATGEVEVLWAHHGCTCPDRPDQDRMVAEAREVLTDRERAAAWEALYAKHPEVV